jgi:hypothetical protein
MEHSARRARAENPRMKGNVALCGTLKRQQGKCRECWAFGRNPQIRISYYRYY